MRSSSFSVITVLLLIALLTGACRPIQAPPPQQAVEQPAPPTRILFIGDSFSMFLEELFPRLAASVSPPTTVEVGLIWEGAAPLSLHWDDRYTLDAISTGDWNFVVLQEDIATNWWRVNEFPEYVRKFQSLNQEAGAATVLFMSWAWQKQPMPSPEQIAATYDEIGTELGVKVAPVALAWERAATARPELALYTSEGVHASPVGAYLTICVLYATIFEQSPVGATYRMAVDNRFAYGWSIPEGWQLSDEDAEFLQRIAWDTVVEQQGQP